MSGSQVEVNDIKNAFERGEKTAWKIRPNVCQPPGLLAPLLLPERYPEVGQPARLPLQPGTCSVRDVSP